MKILIIARWFGFAYALTLLVSRLGSQLHGAHVFRQSLVVSNIDKMREHGLFTIQGAYNQGMPDLIYDFPVFQAISAGLAGAMDLESFVAARLLGLLVFVASFVVLMKLLRLVEARAFVRELTLLLFCLAPIQVFYCSAPVPDSLACCLALLAVLAHEKMLAARGDATGLDRRRRGIWQWCLVAILCSFTATLIKIPVFIPAAAVIAWRGYGVHGIQAMRRREYVGMAAAVLIAIVGYNMVSNQLNEEWHRDHVITEFGSRLYWYFSNLTDRSNWDHYARIFSYQAKYLLNPLTFALCLYALPARRAKTRAAAAPFAPWLIGSVVAILLFFNLQWRHNYYQLPYVVPFCYFAALGASSIHHWLGPRRVLQVTVLALLLGVSWFFSARYLLRLDQSSADYVERLSAAGAMLRRTTTVDDFVVYLVPRFDNQPEHLYFAQRDGYTTDARGFDQLMLDRISERHQQPGRLVVFCPSDARQVLEVQLEDLGLREVGQDVTGSLYERIN